MLFWNLHVVFVFWRIDLFSDYSEALCNIGRHLYNCSVVVVWIRPLVIQFHKGRFRTPSAMEMAGLKMSLELLPMCLSTIQNSMKLFSVYVLNLVWESAFEGREGNISALQNLRLRSVGRNHVHLSLTCVYWCSWPNDMLLRGLYTWQNPTYLFIFIQSNIEKDHMCIFVKNMYFH